MVTVGLRQQRERYLPLALLVLLQQLVVVAVVEATFAEAQASITLPFGHTAIAAAAPALTAVLHFLRHRAFPPVDDSR